MDRKKLVIGILAHVDSGKTTLAESMLYISGSIRTAGRVDHGDTFLDTDVQERARGITIFSKQAQFSWKEMDITLLDTPGHVDFSAEMERTLQVLDYAVLVISGADGVQEHTVTLWRLLKKYRIPVFLFVNKMDQPGADRQSLMQDIEKRLSGQCVDFTSDGETEKRKKAQAEKKMQDGGRESEEKARDDGIVGELAENIAVCDEKILESYLERGSVSRQETAALVSKRRLFPCYFGSALKIEGVEELLDGILQYTETPQYPPEFGARVYKIGRDSAGNRLTYMKITGGSLHPKQVITGKEKEWEEKTDQIRIYSGSKYKLEKEAPAGTVCAVTGLSRTFSGEGLGVEKNAAAPLLAPVMTYRVILPPEEDVHTAYKKLCQLEEEEPLLHIVWKEQLEEIHAQLMGEVQIDILKNMIKERFDMTVEFDVGSIVYKETIRQKAEGVGHFEPLRHYAEVHLILEPGEPGSGLIFDTICSEDTLDRNWQRLVLTHLEEKEHRGLLTGAPITDMKITLAAGRAHIKHTEGGDFRQATYRALRQGLHKADCVLLEPVYEFRLELPQTMIGRAMSDIRARYGRFDAPVTDGEISVLTGTVPASEMQDYQTEVMTYSGGRGRLSCTLKGYEPCHNEKEVIEAAGYDAERDTDNPSSSVFCSHGAGMVVPWQDVEKYMHIESVLAKEAPLDEKQSGNRHTDTDVRTKPSIEVNEKELEEIFKRTYASGSGRGGWNKAKGRAREKGTDSAGGAGRTAEAKVIRAEQTDGSEKKSQSKLTDMVNKEYLLVDGYNIIFAWEELSELAKVNLDSARGRLMDILSNYQGYRKMTLILVFDAYKVKGSPGSISAYHNIYVVYTKEAETADQYIEKATHEIAGKNQVTVATSDGLEQLIIMGQGARRMSARELKEDIMSTNQELRELFLDKQTGGRQYLLDALPEEMAKHMEAIRLGKEV
ncbi:MAG: TetM/TetW/TetO/TetS family tetracycline resistance ribosomal protection protein [Bacillus sp. (in: Bacteria)]|nr:TetM/TetW/TetO/TetS family tetracycline resistance ribosomal protection protein [Bacillus sp. (in: firmicutes)]MCM1426767.1 TetM/TetW/TetO/TetS family tetracycline resistance ribosomal protection protein [Eubacterium sp.]